MELYPSTKELNETLQRPDTINLCIDPYADAKVVAIVDWSEVDEINGDYGIVSELIVTGIPLYPDASESLSSATRYIFNQVEIRELMLQNWRLSAKIGQ